MARARNDDLYTTAEVALVFRVHEKHAVRWLKAGRLTGFKTPGGQWRVPRTEVVRFLPDDLDPDALIAAHRGWTPSLPAGR